MATPTVVTADLPISAPTASVQEVLVHASNELPAVSAIQENFAHEVAAVQVTPVHSLTSDVAAVETIVAEPSSVTATALTASTPLADSTSAVTNATVDTSTVQQLSSAEVRRRHQLWRK